MDNFGGILGLELRRRRRQRRHQPIHYSELQANYGMIRDCQPVDPALFRPATWSDEKLMGTWNPTLDGLMVQVNGAYTQVPPDPGGLRQLGQLRAAKPTEAANVARSTKVIDPFNRVRFPYGFATDRWADLGNLSVYRHDNGADPYELFDFLITQQEVGHIFDNYRRNRQTFSVRGRRTAPWSATTRSCVTRPRAWGSSRTSTRTSRWTQGYDYDSLWPYLGTLLFSDNLLASGIGFDHFARQVARPEAGPHFLSDGILRSTLDTAGNAGDPVVTIPNGATGYYGNVGLRRPPDGERAGHRQG